MANMGHVVRLSTYISDCMRAATSNDKAGAGEETAGSKPQVVVEDPTTAERMRSTGEAILGALNAWPEWSAPSKSSSSTEPNEVFAGEETKPAADAEAAAASATPASAPADQQQTLRERWMAFVEGPIEEMRNKNKIALRVWHLITHSFCNTVVHRMELMMMIEAKCIQLSTRRCAFRFMLFPNWSQNFNFNILVSYFDLLLNARHLTS